MEQTNCTLDWQPCICSLGGANMQKITYVVLGILILGLAFFAYNQYGARQTAETGLSNQYARAFFELSNSINSATANLGKALVSQSDTQTAQSLAQITRDAFNAQAHLTNMPLPQSMLVRTSQFLNQLGDYSLMLSRATAGATLTQENRKTLQELFENSKALGNQLEEIQTRAEVGNLTWRDLREESRKNPADSNPFSDGFQLISDDLNRVPSLVYDGPFSADLQNTRPKALVGDDISREEAERIAEQIVSEANGRKIDLRFVEDVQGLIPAYGFESQERDFYIDISKTGGMVTQFVSSRPVGSTKISLEEATNRATEFIQKQDWPSLDITYSLAEGHTLLVNFAPIQDKAIIYSDLIKIIVALDNGQILAQDTLSYIMNHQDRNIPEPILSPEEAKQKLADNLDPTSTKLALIPRTTRTEALCYEIRARLEGRDEEFIVYIDALTGQEVNILYVVPDTNGTVTM